jgi:hypothetical protein
MAVTMTLDDLVTAARQAAGADVIAVVLYGSAAGRDYHDGATGLDTLVLLRNLDAAQLRAFSPAVQRWVSAGNAPPLLLTEAEWRQRADVFPMEYADLLERHRVLHGHLPVDGVAVSTTHLRLQLEAETMGKLLRLRRAVLSAAGHDDTRELLAESLSSMLALLRATLHLHGEASPASSDAVCDRAAQLAGFDAAPFRALLAERRGDARPADAALDGIVFGIHEALERLVAHLDQVAVTA